MRSRDGSITRYSFVYVKPDGGGQGRGIYRISAEGKVFQVQGVQRRKTFQTLADVQRAWVLRRIPQSYYSAGDSKISDGCPFDIRVHVQRLKGKWIVGGMVGKVGAPSEIVTNRHRGGRPVPIRILLRRHLDLDRSGAVEVKRRLKHLAIETAKAMTKGYPGWLEYGIDIGIDSARRL